MERLRKSGMGERVIVLVVGILVGLMLTGTAVAAGYLTRTQGNKLYLQNTKIVVGPSVPAAGSTYTTASATCPSGYQAIGGGMDAGSFEPPLRVVSSGPVVGGDRLFNAAPSTNGSSDTWQIRVVNDGGGSWSFAVAVICSK